MVTPAAVKVWDTVYVRARRRDVHPLLAEPASYGAWWPGARVEQRGAVATLWLRPPGWPRRTQCLRVGVLRVRPDLGVHLRLDGDFAGRGQWYYLDGRDGVLVHYLLHGRTAGRGWRRRLAAHRAAVRAGLHALKDRMEAGRAVGDEPDPGLVADQADAKVAVDARIAASAQSHGRSRR